MSNFIERRQKSELLRKLAKTPAVALLGPRQVGKTTLAQAIVAETNGVYLDCQDYETAAMLDDGGLRLHADMNAGKLIVLDEIQRQANLFPQLRGIIDQRIRESGRKGYFLLLGSATIKIANRSDESLMGRIAYVGLNPLDVLEMPEGSEDEIHRLWLRGGLPASFTASSDADSYEIRGDIIRNIVSEEMDEGGMRIGSGTIRALCTLLAHHQGQPLNFAEIANIMTMDSRTVKKFIGRITDLLIARALPPCNQSVKKRMRKSPKFYFRDSGLLHRLLNVKTKGVMNHNPLTGVSWEGFVIENILSNVPQEVEEGACYYRSSGGAEIDLIIEGPDAGRWAIEIKKHLDPSLSKGFYSACEDLRPARRFVVHGGRISNTTPEGVESMSLPDMCREVAAAFAD